MKKALKQIVAMTLLFAVIFSFSSCVITQNFEAYSADLIVICDKNAKCYTTITKEAEINEITSTIFSKTYKIVRRATEDEPYIYHVEFREDAETDHPFVLIINDSMICYEFWVYSVYGENAKFNLDYFGSLIERNPIPK